MCGSSYTASDLMSTGLVPLPEIKKGMKTKERTENLKKSSANIDKQIQDILNQRKNVTGGDYKGELVVENSEQTPLTEEDKNKTKRKRLNIEDNEFSLNQNTRRKLLGA